MDDSIKLHAPEDGLQAPPVKRKDDGSNRKKEGSAGKDKSATSSKQSHEKSSKTVSSSVLVVVRPSRSDGPTRTIYRGSDHHRRHSDDCSHKDHHWGLSRRHGSPRAESARHHSPRRHESGERTRPLSSSVRSSSKSRHGADLMDHPRSACVSSKAMESQLSHHHSSRSTVDHRSLPSQSSRAMVNHRSLPSQHHSRCHDADSTDHPGSTNGSRKEINLTSTVPDQLERRTILPSSSLRLSQQVWTTQQDRPTR